MNHYRGKTSDTKQLWIYGGISHIPKYNQYFINIVQNESYLSSIEVEPESVGQYTGLEVNNIKLYDKMKVFDNNNDEAYLIGWNEDNFEWSCFNLEDGTYEMPLWQLDEDNTEIIQD